MNIFGCVPLNSFYTQRIGELCKALTDNNISFEVAAYSGTNGFIVFFPSAAKRKGDVILHDGSYCNECGSYEGYAGMSTVEDDVCIFDTIEEVVEQAKKQGYIKNAE